MSDCIMGLFTPAVYDVDFYVKYEWTTSDTDQRLMIAVDAILNCSENAIKSNC